MTSLHFRNASLKPAIQPRTLVAPAAGKICPQRKQCNGQQGGIGIDESYLRRHCATNPGLRLHYAAGRKAVRSQPAKFSMRLLVIGHGTVSLAAT